MLFNNVGVASSNREAQYTIDTFGQYATDFVDAFGFRIRLLSAVCLVLSLLAGCDEHKQATAPPPQPAVGVRPVTLKGVNQSFEFVGHIMAINKVEVRARVEGFLDKVLVPRRPGREGR